MLKTLVGDADFRRGMDLYFERCDGKAATVEDFLAAFAEVTGRDLSHFAKWYAQAGTPQVVLTGRYDEARREYHLDLVQSMKPTPGQPTKEPMVIPVALGLVGEHGAEINPDCNRVGADGVFVLDRRADKITFRNVTSFPVPSTFRGFSAPVKVSLDLSDDELLALLRHDSDPFNRWQSAQTVAMRLLTRAVAMGRADDEGMERLASSLEAFLHTDALTDPAFAVLVLALPGESEVAQEIAANVNPDAILAARNEVKALVGKRLSPVLKHLEKEIGRDRAYSPDATSAGRRALRNGALDMIAAGDPAAGIQLVARRYAEADNMTDRLGALAAATQLPATSERQSLLDDFRRRFDGEPLVLDKWFALQAMIAEGGTLERVGRLMQDPAFSLGNPNRVRSLVGSFGLNNLTEFHRRDGAGYDFVANIVLKVDASNPQVAARLLTAFGTWKIMEADRREKAEAALRRIAETASLSADVSDIAHRSLS
jgi:aminopeptidase N